MKMLLGGERVNLDLRGYLIAEQLDYHHVRSRNISIKRWIQQYWNSDYKLFINRDIKPCLFYYFDIFLTILRGIHHNARS